MNHQWNREQKWHLTRFTTIFILICRKVEITIFAWGRKLQGLPAQDVLVQLWSEWKFLVIESEQITKFSVKHENQEIIIDTLWENKIWRLSRYNLFRAKKKLLKNSRMTYRSSWSRRGNSHRQFLRIWQVLCKMTNEIPERAVRKVQRGTSAILLQSGLYENGGQDPCNATAKYSESFFLSQNSYERSFGVPFHHPVIAFGAMAEYHPMFAKSPIKISSMLPQSTVKYILRIRGTRWRVWKGDVMVVDIEELDASELHVPKAQYEENVDSPVQTEGKNKIIFEDVNPSWF